MLYRIECEMCGCYIGHDIEEPAGTPYCVVCYHLGTGTARKVGSFHMIKASDLKRGDIFLTDGEQHTVSVISIGHLDVDIDDNVSGTGICLSVGEYVTLIGRG